MASIRRREKGLEFKELCVLNPSNEMERSTPLVPLDMGNAKFHVVKGRHRKQV